MMMMGRVGALLLSWATGCGGDEECKAGGEATVQGSVEGRTVDAVSALYGPHPVFDGFFALVIDERTMTCDAPPTGAGKSLVFIFCAPAAARDYSMVGLEDLPEQPCPDLAVATGLLEEEGGSDVASAMSGSLTVDSTGSCVAGMFSTTFTGGGQLGGSFRAAACESLAAGP